MNISLGADQSTLIDVKDAQVVIQCTKGSVDVLVTTTNGGEIAPLGKNYQTTVTMPTVTQIKLQAKKRGAEVTLIYS